MTSRSWAEPNSDVSRDISERTLAAGHESIEFCIVASGPNGASPHHTPAAAVIRPGDDAIVIDFGGRAGRLLLRHDPHGRRWVMLHPDSPMPTRCSNKHSGAAVRVAHGQE